MGLLLLEKVVLINGEFDLNRENATIVSYPNDLMDGVYVDLDTEYFFISAHTTGYAELLERMDDEGIGYCGFEGELYQGEEPHCYIITALSKLVVATAEQACQEAVDE